MECKYCQEKLEATLVPIGKGYQVVLSCTCGAVWVYDLYTTADLIQIEYPEVPQGGNNV